MREFRDQDGGNWVVYAISNGVMESGGRRYLPDEYQQGWLVFECGERNLRLAPVPKGWDEMSVDELRALLPLARPTTNTTPAGMRAFGAPGTPGAPPREEEKGG